MESASTFFLFSAVFAFSAASLSGLLSDQGTAAIRVLISTIAFGSSRFAAPPVLTRSAIQAGPAIGTAPPLRDVTRIGKATALNAGAPAAFVVQM